MKRIAIFQDDLDIGGIQKSLINLLNSLDYQNFSVDLFLFKTGSKWENKVNRNVSIHYLSPMKQFYKYLPFDFAFTKSKYDFSFVKENYDLAVDFNSYQPWTAAAALIIPAEKRIMWVHNDMAIKHSEEWKYRVLFRAMKSKYQFFEAFAFVSEPLIPSFEKMTEVSDKEYFVIPNVIDTSEMFNASKDKSDEVNIDENRLNVCAVGRLCHQKGYDIMISDFSEACGLNSDLRLYIIGDGPDKDKLSQMVASKKMNDKIFLLGSKENPYSIMNQCDAFISTSRYEGQGMNIMEAKALGLEIIIPKHLEQYVDSVSGTENISERLAGLKKYTKNLDNLEEYNNKILAMINCLC